MNYKTDEPTMVMGNSINLAGIIHNEKNVCGHEGLKIILMEDAAKSTEMVKKGN